MTDAGFECACADSNWTQPTAAVVLYDPYGLRQAEDLALGVAECLQGGSPGVKTHPLPRQNVVLHTQGGYLGGTPDMQIIIFITLVNRRVMS